jgi:RAD51-like protein 3
MRLSSLAPLPAALVSALAERGIRTETDLLFLNARDDIFRKLPPGTTSLRELTEYITLVAERSSAFHARADSLLGKPGNHDRDIETGNPALDNLFRGMAGSNVVELSGDKGSGKTVRHFSGVYTG